MLAGVDKIAQHASHELIVSTVHVTIIRSNANASASITAQHVINQPAGKDAIPKMYDQNIFIETMIFDYD